MQSWLMSGALAYVWMKWWKLNDSICTDSNWLHTDTVLLCYHYRNLFSYTLYLLKKSWNKRSVLNSTNYNKFIHIIIHFVHKLQIQLLTQSVITTFLTFAAHVVSHTLSSAGCKNIHKTLFLDAKLFHRYIKTERKLPVLSINCH
jgi:hypothetical protein